MNKAQEEKLVDEWLKDRKWVRCSICDNVLTVNKQCMTLFALQANPVKVRVECFPCQGRDEECDADEEDLDA